jgi:antirestriction protein ArdC
MFNVREYITNQIVAALEAPGGVPPWRKGWASGGLAVNHSTGNAYQGINQLLLGMSPHSDPRWMTFKQAKAAGYGVRQGEKATKIVRMVEVPRSEPEQAKDGEIVATGQETMLVMRTYDVFNASQIEGMPPLAPKSGPVETVAAAEAILAGLTADGVKIVHGGRHAYYKVKEDSIQLPDRQDFHSTEDFYSTALHEAAHATGKKSRCDRLGMHTRFGTPAYAKEELRAELTAAMLGAELGLPLGETHIRNHASYLASWLELLRSDKTEIFKAASAAQHAADWLKSHVPEVKPQEEAKAAATSEAIHLPEAANQEEKPGRKRRVAGMKM